MCYDIHGFYQTLFTRDLQKNYSVKYPLDLNEHSIQEAFMFGNIYMRHFLVEREVFFNTANFLKVNIHKSLTRHFVVILKENQQKG